MALTFFWRCESTTFSETDDYSAGDSTPTANGSIAAPAATEPRVGTNSIGVDNLGEYYSFDKASIIAIAEGAAAFSFRIVTWENGAELFRFVDNAESSNYLRVLMSGTDELQVQVSSFAAGNTPLATTAANISTGAWYGCVIRWHAANRDLRLEVYDANNGLVQAVENLAVNVNHFATESLFDEVRFGDSGAMASGAYYLDNIMLSDTYDDKLQRWLTRTSYANINESAQNLTLFWRCEGATLDATADYTAGDGIADISTGATIIPGAAYLGSNGLQALNAQYAEFTVSNGNLVDRQVGAVGFWFQLTNAFQTGAMLANLQGTVANDHIRVELTGTADILLRLRLGGSDNLTLATTGGQISGTGTWYFVVARWDIPNDDRRIELYSTSLGTPIDSAEDLSTDLSVVLAADIIVARFGDFNFNNNVYLDNIMLADSYSEPLQTYAAVTSYMLYGVALDVTATFANNYGVSQPNLSAIQWAWFDQDIGALSAPTAQGSVETTDGSGAFSVDVTGTALTSGQTGTLVLYDSSGGKYGAYRAVIGSNGTLRFANPGIGGSFYFDAQTNTIGVIASPPMGPLR